MVNLKGQLKKQRLIPVLRTNDTELAHTGVDWLVEAGLDVIEITMTVPNAPKVIERARKNHPDILIGAGTVFSKEVANSVIIAGAQFVVTPCLVAEVAKTCRQKIIPLITGAATPREVWLAHQAGSEIIKIFPAKSIGGPEFIKSIKAVFPEIDFMPTGGVKPENVQEYLQSGALCVGMGSELMPIQPLKTGDKTLFLKMIQQAMEKAST